MLSALYSVVTGGSWACTFRNFHDIFAAVTAAVEDVGASLL